MRQLSNWARVGRGNEACAATAYQPLLNLLGLKADMAVTGALMVGYPKVKYKRLVDRNPLQVTWVN